MSAKRTLLTAGTAYLAMGSAIVTGLVLIRLATHELSPDEMGLWVFCFGTVGYFLLMDFGVSNSLGRLFADAVAKRDHREMSGWLYLAIGVLSLQAILVLTAGLLLRDPILAWFKIPPNLIDEGRSLWTWLVCLQAAAMPLRALPAFTYARNRVYYNNLFGIGASWVNLGLFWFLLKHGNGVISYAYASIGSTVVLQLGYLITIFTGAERLRICLVPIPFDKLPELFRYSSAILVQSLATQATFAIIDTFTKIRELSSTIKALSVVKDEAKQKSLMLRSREIVADLFDEGLQTSDSEHWHKWLVRGSLQKAA